MPQWVKNIVAWLPVVGLWMLLCSFPFGNSLVRRLSYWVLAIGYIADYAINRRWTGWQWHRGRWLGVAMIALFLLPLLRQLFDPTPPTDYFRLQVHLNEWFLYMGIGLLLGFSDRLHLRHIAYVMLATSVAMAGYAAYLYLTRNMYWDHEPFVRFNMLRSHFISSHMVMNLFLNTAIILGCCAWRTTRAWWVRCLMLVAMLVAAALICLSEGRTGILTLCLIVLVVGIHLIILYTAGIQRWLGVSAVALVFLALLIILWWQHPRFGLSDVAGEPRLAVWDYSWRQAQQAPLSGQGLSTMSETYVEQAYNDSVMYNGFILTRLQQPEYLERGKTMITHHPHSAFLTYAIAYGAGGVVLLLLFFAAIAVLPVAPENRIYLILFLLALLLQALTEPIGEHLRPQFFCTILLIWNYAHTD